MKNFSNFAILLAMASVISTQVASWGGVMGREFMASPNIEHWFRALAKPDDCAGASAGDKVTDPDDCTKFFVCIADGVMTPESFSCPEIDPTSECFDNAAGECAAAGAECDAACIPTPSVCLTECGVAFDQIADITDCKGHYLCLGTTPDWIMVEIYCSADKPYFDGAKCGTDKSACCNCQPGTCVAAGDLIADPTDCHSYYPCTDIGGTPTPVGPILCDGGGSFVSGACDPATTECDNACDLGGGGDTTISAQSTDTSDISTSASSLSTSPSELSSSASELSSSASTTTPGCLDISDFTCPSRGFYARSPFCDPSYFSCDRAGGSITQGECSGNLVFNPNPEYPFCVLPANCPI